MGNTILLAQGQITLGRGPESGLQVDDPQVSRRHAILHVAQDELSVEDLGSTNGIFVNGVRVEGTRLLGHGDVLSLGKAELRIMEEEEKSRRSTMSTVQTSEESAALIAEVRGDPTELTTAKDSLSRLSNREQEVLRLVALGYAQREIAAELGVSVKTVETYRTRINEKMGFKSRVDLVRFAINAGMMDEPA
jgi:DNA-binding CsgD family transcriptional regulator